MNQTSAPFCSRGRTWRIRSCFAVLWAPEMDERQQLMHDKDNTTHTPPLRAVLVLDLLDNEALVVGDVAQELVDAAVGAYVQLGRGVVDERRVVGDDDAAALERVDGGGETVETLGVEVVCRLVEKELYVSLRRCPLLCSPLPLTSRPSPPFSPLGMLMQVSLSEGRRGSWLLSFSNRLGCLKRKLTMWGRVKARTAKATRLF